MTQQTIEQTLNQRGQRYGKFEQHATVAQGIQDAYRVYPQKWDKLQPNMKQALTVIADKIARILNGDQFYQDNWHDIIGYTKLVQDWLIQRQDKLRLIEMAKIPQVIINEGSMSVPF